ncbi:hypothetical protein D8B46_05025, partial [Candidatus Gracilibacteria bacterium]
MIFGLFGINSGVFASDEHRKIAEDYLNEQKVVDYYWQGQSPYISNEKPFYTGDENKPSYMEYKVSCNNDKDCGFIMVNIDDSDVKVPMSSSTGKTLSE